MRRLSVFAGLALMSGCNPPVESEHPLFTAGHDSFKPGLWAMIDGDKPCATPTNTAVLRWPACATPILIEDGRATFLQPMPASLDYVVVDGKPRILQTTSNPETQLYRPQESARPAPDTRYYMAFRPETPSPFTSGRFFLLNCPAEQDGTGTRQDRQEMSGLRHTGEGDNLHCIADTADAVRALAKAVDSSNAGNTFVWIAAYP